MPHKPPVSTVACQNGIRVMAEAGYPAAIEYPEEEGQIAPPHLFAVHQGNGPGFFLPKVTGAPPFHDVNVTQLIVIIIIIIL